MARRMAAMSLVTPLAVSVCTAKTALMACALSSRSACSTAAASIGEPSRQGVRTARRPRASVCTAQDSLKCPVPGTSTASPAAARFSTTASHTPWPLAAYMKTSASRVCSRRLRPCSQAAMLASTRGSARSIGCVLMACSTASGSGVGPGECRKRRPGMREELMADWRVDTKRRSYGPPQRPRGGGRTAGGERPTRARRRRA